MTRADIRDEPWVTNRERKRAPVMGSGWCDRCDGAIVQTGSRCPRCGFRQGIIRRNKKS